MVGLTLDIEILNITLVSKSLNQGLNEPLKGINNVNKPCSLVTYWQYARSYITLRAGFRSSDSFREFCAIEDVDPDAVVK